MSRSALDTRERATPGPDGEGLHPFVIPFIWAAPAQEILSPEVVPAPATLEYAFPPRVG